MEARTMTGFFEHADECSDWTFAELLKHHYGDGIVYLCHSGLRNLYSLAREEGYVSDDGYLTRKGRALLARYDYA